jgi:hypothetical protein
MLIARCTILSNKVCQWLATGLWSSPDPPVSSTNKTDHNDITEILLKVALNTIKQTNIYIYSYIGSFSHASHVHGSFILWPLLSQPQELDQICLKNTDRECHKESKEKFLSISDFKNSNFECWPHNLSLYLGNSRSYKKLVLLWAQLTKIPPAPHICPTYFHNQNITDCSYQKWKGPSSLHR